MRQSLEWQLKKGPQAVVLETSVEFPLDFTGHSIQHSPTPDIFILQPAAVPVQKRQTVPQRRCAAWKKKNLVQIKGWTKAPSEPAWRLSAVPVEWESIVSAQTGRTGVCCKARENVVERNSGLTQPYTYLSTGVFFSVHGAKGFVLSALLC